jgi:hypothetical protein
MGHKRETPAEEMGVSIWLYNPGYRVPLVEILVGFPF